MAPPTRDPIRLYAPYARVRRAATIGLAYVLVYLLLDLFTRRFSVLPGVSPWYPPSGLSLGLVAAFGPAYAPLIFIVNLLGNRFIWALPAGLDGLLGLSLLPCLIYGAAGAILRSWWRKPARLTRTRDILLIALTALLAPLPMAVGTTWLGSAYGILPSASAGEALRQLWVGDAIGIVIIVPFLLVNLLPRLESRSEFPPSTQRTPKSAGAISLGSMAEAAAIGAALGLLLMMVFRWKTFGDPPLVYPLFIPLIWIGLRFGLPGATAFVPAINLMAVLLGSSQFVNWSDIFDLQIFMVTFSLTGLILGAVVSDQRRVNQALSERETQYRRVFESTTDGLIVLDHTGRVVDFNPAACDMLGYTKLTFGDVSLLDLLTFESPIGGAEPGRFLQLAQPSLSRAQGKKVDGSSVELEVRTSALADQPGSPTLFVLHDISEEVHARRRLESRVEDRTRELSLLFDVSRLIASSIERVPPLEAILERLQRVVAFEAAWIRLFSDAHLEVAASWPKSVVNRVADIPLESAHGRAFERMIEANELAEIPDLSQPPEGMAPLAAGIMALCGDCVDGLGAWVGIPLVARGRQQGLLELAHSIPEAFSAADQHLAEGFAQLAAVAVANAALYLQAEERLEEAVRRTDVASGLREVLSALNSELPLAYVKQSIVDQAAALLGTSTIALFERDASGQHLYVTASRGLPVAFLESVRLPVGAGAVGRAVARDEPVALAPVMDSLESDLPQLPDAQSRQAYAQLLETFHAILAVPVRVRGEAIGGLSLYYEESRQITPEETALAVSFADQAALAIENNRLHAQALELAALQERQKLSRELHDSVSQALYGIALGTQTARTLLERGEGDLREPLAYILNLAKAALSEMRALIFELRPDSLAAEGLSVALRKQAESIAARHDLEIGLYLEAEPEISLAAKECLYRVGTEALQNVVKHARAGRIEVDLAQEDGWVLLTVRDDGRGFETSQSYPGHLGLISMRERAEKAGGLLRIESSPGEGTVVELRVPATDETVETAGPGPD
jgi:PAS domain S-box-containing protein